MDGLSDHSRDFQELILANEPLYPGIRSWLQEKVLPGIASGQRMSYIGYLNERPVVSAVVKRAQESKICHIRIADELQKSHLGDVFFCLMGLDVMHVAKEIHFTLPESLWREKRLFFESFAFHDATKAGTQYRLFDMELRCTSSFSRFFAAALEKLPAIANSFLVEGQPLNEGLLMSLKPKYAEAVLAGTKSVEIRRRFSERWAGCHVSLYSSSPKKALVGQATIAKVEKAPPEDIWLRYGTQVACTKHEFDQYTADLGECFAIHLERTKPYSASFAPEYTLSALSTSLRPPQSYCALKNNKGWSQAVSIATLLDASLPQLSGYRDHVLGRQE